MAHGPHNGITRIDHPVIAVRDMAESGARYTRLGFTVPPRGSHVEWGTGNWCIMFPDDYLELRGILDPKRFIMHLDEYLKRHGEGLMGVALGTVGAEESHRLLTANGIKAKPARPLTRNFELPGGWVQPKFKLTFPEADEIEGLIHVVLCEHLTPELIRKPEYLRHANGATGVLSMAGAVADLARVAAKQRRLLGEAAIRTDGEGVHATLPSSQEIHLFREEALRARYGSDLPARFPELPVLAVTTLAVDDLAKTAAALDAGKIAHTRTAQDRIRVPAREACGMVLEFVQLAR